MENPLGDRVQTRQNLLKRSVMVGVTDTCVFCGAIEESADHLFVSRDGSFLFGTMFLGGYGLKMCPQ
jgi:hypothetical protein